VCDKSSTQSCREKIVSAVLFKFCFRICCLEGPSSLRTIEIEWAHQLMIHADDDILFRTVIQGGSNMTGTDLCVNKPHCAAAVRP